MLRRTCALLLLTLTSASCSRHESAPDPAAVENDVRAFAHAVAHDVTEEGPLAWRKHFANSPAFFMAVDGKIAFPSGAAAMAAMPNVALAIPHIELQWGEDLRVDVLSPLLAVVAAPYREIQVDAAGHRVEEKGFFVGVAEYRDGRWQFRDVHWSSSGPPVPVP